MVQVAAAIAKKLGKAFSADAVRKTKETPGLKNVHDPEQRRELLKDLKLAPAWMHPIFRELAEDRT